MCGIGGFRPDHVLHQWKLDLNECGRSIDVLSCGGDVNGHDRPHRTDHHDHPKPSLDHPYHIVDRFNLPHLSRHFSCASCRSGLRHFLTTGPFARAAAPSIARAPCLIDLARDQCLHLISGLFGFKDQRFDAAHMLIAISMRHEDIGVFGGDIIIIAAAL